MVAGDHDVWLAVCTGQDCERAKSVQAVAFLRTLPYVRQGNEDYDDISNVATQMRLIKAEIREVQFPNLFNLQLIACTGGCPTRQSCR